MNDNTRKKWLPLGILAVALVLWAGMFAVGAYLQLGADEPKHDLRKPLIIMGGMAAFLAVWGIALWNRARKRER
jgi:membrane protein DedA with SNARE-associated domain